MSIETAAARVAERLQEEEYVEVYGHHDADGIAAASILCHALEREGVRFRLRIRNRISDRDLTPDTASLLCDFGAALETLPDSVMVVDHHVPHFEGEYHVNPHLSGIDGERELSAAGAAYLVAQHMGDHRDLAGLVILGILGDRQELSGKNREITGGAIANGFIVPHRGLRFPGRDTVEQLVLALYPYLEGVSGVEEAAEELAGEPEPEMLLSSIILRIAPQASSTAMEGIYGDTYELPREVVHDAHTLTALVEACGQAGRGGLGASLCLRSTESVDEAWEVARRYRTGVIAAIRAAERIGENPAVYQLDNAEAVRGAIDALAYDRLQAGPVVAYAQQGEAYTVSGRCIPGSACDLEPIFRRLAKECGGDGGGHRWRAGATVKAGAIDRFRAGITEAMAE